MAFTMLRNLGESKFNTLQDELARGKASLALARTIRSQWGDLGIQQELAGLSMPSRTEGNNCSAVDKERHVYEAVSAVEEIFRKRGIEMEHPIPIPAESDNRLN
jgi:hypothetical protein